jgi:ribosome-binding protein aMBF1 (putative translation factor)
MKINEKIRELRVTRKWSQAKLGQFFTPPVTAQVIQRIESGKFKPSFDTLEELAKIFGTKHEYFKECG